jgi:hypothetical protein
MWPIVLDPGLRRDHESWILRGLLTSLISLISGEPLGPPSQGVGQPAATGTLPNGQLSWLCHCQMYDLGAHTPGWR